MQTDDVKLAIAEKLLFTLHHMLDEAVIAGDALPIGADNLLQRAIDEMRGARADAEQLRRAETVAISLHRLEWLGPDCKAEARIALARLRDDVRLLLTSPADAGLLDETHSGTLFDWPRPRVAEMFVQPTVWLSRMRQHRLATI